MLNYISRRDHRLMRRVNRWPAPRWIRLWALCATRGGDGWLWYGMGAVILLFGGPMRFRGGGRRRAGCRRGHRHFSDLEEGDRTQASLHFRTALLGHAAAARSILLSLGPHDYGLRRGVVS